MNYSSKLTKHSFKSKSRIALSMALTSLGLLTFGHNVSANEQDTPTVSNHETAVNTPNETTLSETTKTFLTVEEFKNNPDLSGQIVTVEGFITGALKNSTQYDNTLATNLALSASTDTPADQAIPVQLSKGSLRNHYNVKDHPNYIGKTVRITDKTDQYFKRQGLKNISTIEFIEPTTSVEPPVTIVPEDTIPPESTLAINEVRTQPLNQVYTVKGKIMSSINGWGGNGFYIEDQSEQGLYIYPKNITLPYQTGDSIVLTGTLSQYNNELQLINITHHQKIAAITPNSPTILTANNLNNEHQSTLIKVNNLTVGTLNVDNYGTVTFNATSTDGISIPVRVDNRTGIKADALQAKIGSGDTINLTAILSQYKDSIQLKPFDLNQFEIVNKAIQPTTPIEESTSQILKIGDVQGASHISPYVNQNITIENAIVTFIEGKTRYYVQDLNPDDDQRTSNGIVVYHPNHTVKIGDVLTIKGQVVEYQGQGYNDRNKTDLTITQIKATTTEKTAHQTAPSALVIGKDIHIPSSIIDNDGLTVFDPQEDTLDFWESIEGMLVSVENGKILGPQLHKELYVVSGNYLGELNKVGGLTLGENDYNNEKIALLFNKAHVAKAGDRINGTITGPVTYSFTNYKILAGNTVPNIIDGGLTPEKTYLQFDENKLTIASYNIENFSANPSKTPDEKVERIATSIISDLNNPDIITLIEVQDNDGETDSGNTDASQSANRLISAIKKQGGVTYQYIDIAPDNNQDGGAPGGNIRTGFLYNPERVTLSSKPKGDSHTTATWSNGKLSHSIARIAPTDPLWKNVRKPLVANFNFKGEDIAVIAVHLNSKRGDQGVYGKNQPVSFASEPKRHQLAESIHQFVADAKTQNPEANIVIVGDFNDYEFSRTFDILEKDFLFNLVRHHDQGDRFSYFHHGNNQSLDNIVLSTNLKDRYLFDMVHVNSPFMVHHGRASDHDPLIVQLDLRRPIKHHTSVGTSLINEDKPTHDIESLKLSQVGTSLVNESKPDANLDKSSITNIPIKYIKDARALSATEPKNTVTTHSPEIEESVIETIPQHQSTTVETLEQLPQTGEDQNYFIFTAAALAILASVGLDPRSKKIESSTK